MLEPHLKEVHDYCSEPRRARDIAEHLGIEFGTAQWRITKLRKMKALDMHRTKKPKSKVYECWYTKVDLQEPKVIKPYEPLGMCIWGVWM